MHKKGGLEKYLDRLAMAFVNAGYEVEILTSTKHPILGQKAYKITSLCQPWSCSWLHMLIFDYKVKKVLANQPSCYVFGFDRHFLPLTHYRAGNGCHKAYLARRLSSVNFFKKICLLLNPLHWLTIISEKKTLESSQTHIFCNSNMVQQEFLHFYPHAFPDHLHVIHNGVEWNEFAVPFQQRVDERRDFCSQKGILPTLPHILFIGNEWERKGVKYLIESLAGIDLPFRCSIVGAEKKYTFYESLIKQYHLEEKVELRPFHEPSLQWYQRADILAIPSLYDPFANVTVEALAMGLYVVSFVSNGGSEVLVKGSTGSIVADRDSVALRLALVDAIQKILQDPQMHERIREEAKDFDFSISLKKYLCLTSDGSDTK